MRGIPVKKRLVLASALLCLLSLHTPSQAASEEDLQTLGMYFEQNDLVVTATRNPKLLSQTAENITVVTASEIEMMGAHTLADVLNNVPGISVDDRGSVGTFSSFSVQGASFKHVLVMLDGVMLNFFSTSDSNIAAIPVENIERIEIVKGPGSSSWGSSLGGVINIITKSPRDDKKAGGALSASYGEKTTRDLRGEVSGTIDRFGYYLYGGHLASDGLRRHSGIELNTLYTKLNWELPERGNLTYTFAYADHDNAAGQALSIDAAMGGRNRYLLSTLALSYPLNERLDLDLSLRGLWNRNDISDQNFDMTTLVDEGYSDETSYGGSTKLTWRGGIQALALGLDFDHVNHDSWLAFPPDPGTFSKIHGDKWGAFLNDIISFRGAKLTVTPGVRYDRLNPVGDFYSPSLGVAWNPTDKITLRLYGARGYSLPVIQSGVTQEKVWTAQAGAESTYIPGLWLKTTFFLNYLSDVNSSSEKDKKQGIEVEGKTVPIFNTSLSFGYTFIDAKNRDTGETIKESPRHLLKLGIHYDDLRSFRAALLGRYVDWQSLPEDNGRYSAVVWDLNLAKRFNTFHGTTMELFLNVHNLFNDSQYWWDEFRNAGRWVEGGLKFNF